LLTIVALSEYNINGLRPRFGQLKDIRYETMEPGKPSLVTHSSTLDKNENDIVIFTNEVLKELAKMELRKRFAIVHTDKYVYVIGGALNIDQKEEIEFLSAITSFLPRLYL
jgi:hypothetical protein